MLASKCPGRSGLHGASQEDGLAPAAVNGRGSQGAFYHKASKTLMVTDAVVYLPVKPPEVCHVAFFR